MPLPTTRDLAQAAYAAYGTSTGHKNYQGHPMPDWGDLTASIQLAWIEAAGAVILQTMTGLTGVQTSLVPDVGDVVLVAADPAENNGAAVAPAIVTRVWNETTINARVLHDGPGHSWRTSLVYRETLDGADGTPAAWTWPGGDS